MKSKKERQNRIRSAALKLMHDKLFLWRVIRKIGEMGIVGEKRNLLILFLAGLTKDFAKPVSVIEKGASSTGKSELVKAVIALFPPECIQMRASLSKKAPVYGSGDLSGKILYIVEYRGARDSSYLGRLLQSEGRIDHEFATAVGNERGTVVATRMGSPVVLTTTTQQLVFEDDESRFLSVQVDDSCEQTQDVIAAQLSPEAVEQREEDFPVWQTAIRLLGRKIPSFRHPEWFNLLAKEIPSDEPRARRDVVRFLGLLKAVALCKSHSDGRMKEARKQNEIELNFADYCVAHRILSRAFTSTFAGVHPQALMLAKAVRRLNKRLERPVSINELAEDLKWKQAVVYKHAKEAEKQKLVEYESGSHRWNQKRLLPGLISRRSFLPDPNLIFQKCQRLGDEVRYVDPLSGKEKVIRRSGDDD